MYRNPLHCFRKIVRAEGVKGLYRGLPPNLIGVTPEKAIKLAANDLLREHLSDDNGNITLPNEILAGGGAGFMQVIATNPMEITKIRLQVQGTLPPSVPRQSAVEIVQSLGLQGLYRGTPATLLRDVPFSLIFFPLFANLKKYLS